MFFGLSVKSGAGWGAAHLKGLLAVPGLKLSAAGVGGLGRHRGRTEVEEMRGKNRKSRVSSNNSNTSSNSNTSNNTNFDRACAVSSTSVRS